METPDQEQLTDYSPDGVDLTLIRWMLSLTPAQRIELFEQHVNDVIAMRELNAGTYLTACVESPKTLRAHARISVDSSRYRAATVRESVLTQTVLGLMLRYAPCVRAASTSFWSVDWPRSSTELRLANRMHRTSESDYALSPS